MKKIFLSFIALSALLSGCSDDYLQLSPLDAVTQDTYYKTEADISHAVTGIYAAMVDGGTTRGFAISNYTLLSEVRSNNYEAVSTDAAADWYEISRFQETSSTDALEAIWSDSYQLIYYSNEVLENIDNVYFTNNALKERYRAEARFLRAYTHFELVRIFGRVPLVDHVMTVAEAKTTGLAELDKLYDFIISELEATVEPLPVNYSGEDVGRVSKMAAHAMLGRVLLTRAGYPLNQTQYLEAAKTHLKAVIDQEGKAFKWAAKYSDLFTIANENLYNIFEIQHISGGLSAGTFLPSFIGPAYGTKDPRYNKNGGPLHSASRIQVSSDLINLYEDKDVRFDATIDTLYTNDKGVKLASKFFDKFREPGLVISSKYDWPTNFPIIRYEDVILMYAEILNAQGATADAVPFLNRTRVRAGLTALDASISSADFLVELKKERRLEFAGEGVLWYDLVRWNDATSVMNAWFAKIGEDIVISQDNYTYDIPWTQIKVVADGIYE